MSYFTRFPKIYYPFLTENGIEHKLVKDICLNVRFRKKILENITLYDEYDMEEGEKIDHEAYKLYGRADLHWVLMIANSRYDYISDFPLSTQELEEYVTKKYGEGNRDDIHILFGAPHYEDENGNVVDSTYPNARAVTNYDYEFRENERKRRIKVISPELISIVLRNMDDLFDEALNVQI